MNIIQNLKNLSTSEMIECTENDYFKIFGILERINDLKWERVGSFNDPYTIQYTQPSSGKVVAKYIKEYLSEYSNGWTVEKYFILE